MSLKYSSIGSSGIEDIVFTYESSTVRFQGITNNVSLSIATDYPDARNEFFSDREINAGFDACEFDVKTSGDFQLNLYGGLELTVVEMNHWSYSIEVQSFMPSKRNNHETHEKRDWHYSHRIRFTDNVTTG